MDRMMMDMVSVVVATYNPDWNKLYLTLMSIVMQKGIELEIIISDDGSKAFPENRIRELFRNVGVENFLIRRSDENKGILDNCYNACKLASGKYIKLISPGDLLFSIYTLSEWVSFMKRQNLLISFGDAVNYKRDSSEIQIIKERNMPRVLKPYEVAMQNIEAQRLNYLLLGDVANGATFMCDRELLITYFIKMYGKIVYAEDLAYRFMVLDGIALCHYPHNVIWYENGTGVSWDNTFAKKLEADVDCMEEMIMNAEYESGSFADKYQSYLKSVKNKKRKITKRLIRLRYFPKIIYWEEYRKIKTIYTPLDVDGSYIKMLANES